MLVIGVDPGTAITGYGLVSESYDGKLTAIDYGVIETPSGDDPGNRLATLFTEIQKILHLHRPDHAAVEKLFFQRNVTTALAVGQARGVILLALTQQSIPTAEYTPMEVKQAVCGYGGAEKSQVQQMVKALLELERIPTPDDAADALAIAICHLNSAKYKSLGG
jgi:crossover junction endodeoxyribonuclease RuvC